MKRSSFFVLAALTFGTTSAMSQVVDSLQITRSYFVHSRVCQGATLSVELEGRGTFDVDQTVLPSGPGPAPKDVSSDFATISMQSQVPTYPKFGEGGSLTGLNLPIVLDFIGTENSVTGCGGGSGSSLGASIEATVSVREPVLLEVEAYANIFGSGPFWQDVWDVIVRDSTGVPMIQLTYDTKYYSPDPVDFIGQIPLEPGEYSITFESEMLTFPFGGYRQNESRLRFEFLEMPDPPCSAADFDAPFGQLDFSDVVAFLGAFGASDPAADLAEPIGVFDFSDVVAFLGAFGAGCP